MESKYLSVFKEQEPELKKHFELIGDCLLVELIKDDEFKTKSGLIIAPSSVSRQINGLDAEKPCFVRVLMTGQGFYNDETKEPVDLESKPGDIVLVGRTSVKPFSVFGRLMTYGETQIGLLRESDIQGRFRGQESFDRFFEEVNKRLEGKIQSNRE